MFADLPWQDAGCDDMSSADAALLAERANVMPRFNEWLVNDVCRQLDCWRDAGIDRPISIQVSRAQVADGHLARQLSARLSAEGLEADLLEVCIDHGLLLEGTDHRIRNGLRQLAELGIKLVISGVGEGAVAFGNMKDLPIHCVGLATSMIAAIGRCSHSETMLKALIGFVHRLDLKIRTVGVFSNEQLDFLRHHGCDEAIGPLFAPALEGRDIDRLTNFELCFNQQNKLRLAMPSPLSMH